jgi:hypothetical protein
LALLAWFLLWDWIEVAWRLAPSPNGGLGVDTAILYRAVRVWLDGGNPWDASVHTYHFAGLPPTLQVLAPLSLLTEPAAMAAGLCASVLAAIVIVRSLRLPPWWLLFPPLAQGVVVANPHIVLLALLLSGGPIATALATALKAYGIVPALIQLRWRAVAATGVVLAASFALAPGLWMSYLDAAAATSGRLLGEAGGGYNLDFYPLFIIPMSVVILALAIVDRNAASWLAVPAVWPASQFFYSTMALPVMRPWLAVLLAVPWRGMPALAVVIYVAVRLVEVRRARSALEYPRPMLTGSPAST